MNTKATPITKYAGADWLQRNLKYLKPGTTVSDLGIRVADFLGEWLFGIYHLDNKWLSRVDWSNDAYIEISFYAHGLSTTDFDDLTRLVFLAHHLAIRVQIQPCNYRYLRLTFVPRGREAPLYKYHPTLDEAVEEFRRSVSLSEVT